MSSYIVVSKWTQRPGADDGLWEIARQVRAKLRAIDGVEYISHFQSEQGGAIAIVRYRSKADYDRIVGDPEGPFAQTIKQFALEDFAEWQWSERGEVAAD